MPAQPETLADVPTALRRRARNPQPLLTEVDERTLVDGDSGALDDEHPLQPADTGRFEIGPLLGAGGMGVVRIARDNRIGREVAIKAITGEHDRYRVARFLREARIQARLEHPAIVPVYDVGVDDSGKPYFAMKRLTGTTLDDILVRRGQIGSNTLLARLVEVCFALELAHRHGVIHRDIKPANIMLGEYGEVYVLDWGIARVLDEDIDLDDLASDPRSSHATLAGAIIGTLGYMPPEQLRGESVDARADVYALGCVLFEILTGDTALSRTSTVAPKTALSPRARHPELDIAPELDELCRRATAPDVEDRLPSARAFAEALQRYLDGDRDAAHRRTLATELARTARGTLSATSDEAARKHAMREAGRALALDPENVEAQELVGALLVSPAHETNAEVERGLEVSSLDAGKAQMRIGASVYGGYVAILCMLWAWTGRSPWVLALAAAVAVNGVGLMLVSRRDRPLGAVLIPGLLVHGGTIALAGFVLSPVLVIPALAVGAIVGFLSQPACFRPVPVIIGHVACVLVPVALELAGVTPRTFSFDSTGLHVHPWALDLTAGGFMVVMLTVAIGQLLSTAALVIHLRRARETAERRMHVQLWRLRQLLPAVTLGIVLCLSATGCLAELGPDGDSPDDPAANLSPLGTSIVRALQAQHADGQDVTWAVSTDNALPGDWLVQTPIGRTWDRPVADLSVATRCNGQAGCDAELALLRCSSQADCVLGGTCTPVRATVKAVGETPRSLCVGHSDAMVDQVYDLIASAQSSVDISSLVPPDGRFEVAIHNALAFLGSAGRTVRVRLLYGAIPGASLSGQVADPPAVLEAITHGLPSTAHLHVTVAEYRNGPDSWDHAKIIAVDGRAALVGGHNLMTRHYLQAAPAFDLSMQVTGTAAAHATRYVESLWQFTCHPSGLFSTVAFATYPDANAQCRYVYEEAVDPPSIGRATGNVRVISAGRLGAIGDNAGDGALVALIDAAQSSLRISQQDLGGLGRQWPEQFVRALVDAAARGVDIEMVISNPDAYPDGLTGAEASYSNGVKPSDVVTELQSYARDHGVTANLCPHLHIASLRHGADDAWPSGARFANHAKLVVADEAAFYIGSQNMYPSNLAEYGFIVDDALAAKQLMTDYYTKLWAGSQRTVAACN